MHHIGIVLGDAGDKLSTAILFMNSNKSERNIRKKVAKTREKCISHGIILCHAVVIHKGPDIGIDRNLLISFLLKEKFQMIVVDRLTEITTDLFDLEEFLDTVVVLGVSVFEFFTMQVRRHAYMEGCPDYPSGGNPVKMRS